VGGGFGDGCDGDERDAHHDGPGARVCEGREGDVGHAQPVSGPDQPEVDQAEGDGDEVADNRAQQDRQHAQQSTSLQIYRECNCENEGDERYQPIDRRHAHIARSACGHFDRLKRQCEAYHNRHAAGNNWRQDSVERRLADALNQQAEENFDDRSAQNADLRDAHAVRAVHCVRIVIAFGCVERHHGDDDGDVGKAGAVIERDAPPGNEQGDNGAQAACQQRDADIELGEDSHEDGGREHGQHLLKAEAQHGADGWGVFRHVAEDGLRLFRSSVASRGHEAGLLCLDDGEQRKKDSLPGEQGSARLPGCRSCVATTSRARG